MFSDNSAVLDWADKIVLDPETYIGPWSEPVRIDDGCWRFPEDGEQSIQSIVEYYEIAPSQSLREEYDVYTSSHASTCLPEGTYRFQDQGTGGGEAYGPTLTLVLEIDEHQQLSASTEEPLI